MPPKPYTPPTFPVSFSKPPATVDVVADTMDSIILSEDSHSKCERFASGTVRVTRKESTPEEIATEKQAAHARRSDAWLNMGSSQTGDETAPTSPLTPQEGK